MRVDNVLFIVDKGITDENVLAFLSAFQAYERDAHTKIMAWNRIYKQQETLELNMFLVCPQRYHFIFERCMQYLRHIGDDIASIPQVDYTNAVLIDVDAITNLCASTKRPLAQGIGFFVGSEAESLANVSNLLPEVTTPADYKPYTYIDYRLYEKLLPTELMKQNIMIYDFKADDKLEDRLSEVYNADKVIGNSSFETYLACCLRKPVVEVQLNFSLYKWSNKAYACIQTDKVTPALLEGAIHHAEAIQRTIDNNASKTA